MSKSDGDAEFDAIVVGAGFAGIYALYRLKKLGFRTRVFETAEDVGGTWYWNRYPGARCDSESLYYSYSFSEELQQEWEWTERYATQPEILSYIRHVAERFDLRPDIRFRTRVTAARWEEETARWRVETDQGDVVWGRFLLMATGCLSAPRNIDFQGMESFQGDVYLTSDWPPEGVDLSDRRVGVIGTGSSGIQAIPMLAERARHLTVFQRTPNFCIPAHNRPHDPVAVREFKAVYAYHRQRQRESRAGTASTTLNDVSALAVGPEERQAEYESRWAIGGAGFVSSFNDLLTSASANETAAAFVRDKIAQTVRDPAVAALLMPRDHPLGTKRICVGTDYYETYNRANVTLVDVRADPIQELIPTGLRTESREFELDTIVFATGFDAMTGALLRIEITGKGDLTLREKWDGGPRTYLGLATAGFPNLFTITGPGSPSVLINMVYAVEQHVDWIAACLDHMRARGITTVEADAEAEDRWVDHVNEVSERTLYPLANSWYVGANVPGKPRVFMPYVGGAPTYVAICDDVAARGYDGFSMGTVKATEPARTAGHPRPRPRVHK